MKAEPPKRTSPPYLEGRAPEDIDLYMSRMIGFHPIEGHPLNLMEQINQTWTYAVALEATRKLLEIHPDAGGFLVAPGAHMSLSLDIMSIEAGLVGAEVFAAVDPRNNRKLKNDLAKMAARDETHKYVFFPGTQHLRDHNSQGVQVWSVDV
jgi:hypothetical protein